MSVFPKEWKPLNYESQSTKNSDFTLSIVIPLYNESESLNELHEEICRVCEDNHISFQVIYVDDGSTDGSFNTLEKIHKADARTKVIQFRTNFGKSDALSAGFSVATGDMIVTMDADLQDDPNEIPKLIAKLRDGYDLISGWKRKRRDPLSKRIPSRFFNFVTAKFTRLPIHDFNCGLKIYRREVVETINVYGELHRYIPALAKWEGFRIGEIEVNHRARKHGKTKYGLSRFLRGPLDLMTVMFLSKYTKRPLHLFGLIGLFSTLIGTGITIYLLILRLIKATWLTNRPLLYIGILLIILGIQFISIGLLGEMITQSHTTNQKYSIRRTLGV